MLAEKDSLKIIEKVTDERSKIIIPIDEGSFELYLFEMSIGRQELFIELIQTVFKSMQIKENTELIDIIKKIPIDKMVEIFNFICFPKACLGCNGHKKNNCNKPKMCSTEKKKVITKDWFKENITNRIIKEVFQEVLKQNQLEKMFSFFFNEIKRLILMTMYGVMK